MSQMAFDRGFLAPIMDQKPAPTRPLDEWFENNLEGHLKTYRSRLTKEEVERFQRTTLDAVKITIVQI